MRRLDSWISAYLAYTAESESPESFHLWCGISAIAGALRRRVFFDMGYFQVYPNLYVVLVSPPGRCKKSTALRLARSVIAKVPGINFTVDSTSRERLIQDLSQAYVDGHSSMVAYSSEFASLFATSGIDMVVFLTDIFDSPDEWIHKTKSGGSNKIKSPCLTLAAGTTPMWIASAMPLDTIGIGLTSRTIFVYEENPRPAKPIPVLSKAQIELNDLLVADLADMAQLTGEYKFTEGAFADYEHWYLERFNESTEVDPRLSGYYERKPIHIIKLCMIIAATRRDDLLITEDDLRDALRLLEVTEKGMPRVFASVGKNELNADLEEILGALARAGTNGLTRRELLNKFKHNLREEELSEILNVLLSVDQVKLVNGKFILLG